MKHKLTKASLLLAFILTATVFAATPLNASAKGKISKKSANLCVGETVKLKISGASGKTTWSTGNKKVATVKNGLVTAKGEGTCKITAKQGKKKYTCAVKVVKLPEDYATINGKKVKVGDTVTITYKIQNDKPLSNISIEYFYDSENLKITNLEDLQKRFTNWVCNEYISGFIDGKKGECDLYHLVGVNKKNPYDTADISCSKPKTVDTIKVKAEKSGNYTIKADYYMVSNRNGKNMKKFKVTTTIK